MASHPNMIITTDDEGLPSPEPGGSRPRRASRRDYSYRDFKSQITESIDATDMSRPRKRKRTETHELSTLAVKKLRYTVDREIELLRLKIRILQEEEHQKTKEELSLQREHAVLDYQDSTSPRVSSDLHFYGIPTAADWK